MMVSFHVSFLPYIFNIHISLYLNLFCVLMVSQPFSVSYRTYLTALFLAAVENLSHIRKAVSLSVTPATVQLMENLSEHKLVRQIVPGVIKPSTVQVNFARLCRGISSFFRKWAFTNNINDGNSPVD